MFGLSDHDLMFSQGGEAGDHQDDHEEEEENRVGGVPENDYILHRVSRLNYLQIWSGSQINDLKLSVNLNI